MNLRTYTPVVFLLLLAQSGYGQRNDGVIPYDRNVVYITPFIATEEGKGVGIGYERFFGQRGLFSCSVPLYIVWNIADYTLDSIANHTKQAYTITSKAPYYYMSPGIKYYPGGYRHRLKYGVGLSLLIAKGTTIASEDNQMTYNFAGTEGQKYGRSITGFLIANTIDVIAMRYVAIKMEFNAGLTVSNSTGGTEQDMRPLYNFAVNIGYRF